MKNLKFTIWLFALLLVGWTTNAQTVQIGSGAGTNTALPISGGWVFSYSQQIYTQAQINTSGEISKIRFFYVSGTTAPSLDWVIYMGHTSKTTFSSTTDWVPVSSLTEVFNGQVTYPAVGNWMEITLTTPFVYNNTDNLVIVVDENTNNSYSSITWRSFTSGSNTGIYYRSDVTNPDPANPPTASSRVNVLPQVQLYFTETCPGPIAVFATPTSTTNATISWVAPASAPANGYQYEVRSSGAAGSGATGLAGSGSTLAGVLTDNVGGLTASTTYSVYVRSNCGSGDYSAWSMPQTFLTPCVAFTSPITESFESTTAPPDCWTVVYQNPSPPANNIITHSTTVASQGTRSFRFSSTSFGAPYHQWLISPELNYATDMVVKFKYRKSSTTYAESFAFGTSSSGNNVATDFTWEPTINTMSTTAWTEYEKIIPAGTKYISINYTPAGAYAFVYIDELSIQVAPSCATPTEQPTALVLTPAAGAISGSYTASATADSYLVLRTTVATPSVAPVDGTTYTVGNTLGNATIVKAATGNTFNSTGLVGGNTYYFHVYAMNSNCIGGPKYFTTAPLSGSSAPLLTAPAAFTATATNATNINLVTTANADNNNVIIAWNSTNTFGTPTGTYTNGDAITGGGTVLYQGVAGNFSHTPLNPATTYYYRVWSQVGSNYSATGLSANATTQCSDINTYPFTETFSTFLPSVCWSKVTGGNIVDGPSTTISTKWVADGFLNSGTTGSAKINIYTTSANDWLMTPQFSIPASAHRLKYHVGATQFASTAAPITSWEIDDTVQVLISTNGSTNWILLKSYNNNNVPSNIGQEEIVDLASYAGQTVRFAFRAIEGTVDGGADIDFFIDNFVVEEIPSCGYPTALNTGIITTTTAVLNWTVPTEGTPTGYNWIVVPRGAGSSATPVASGTTATTTATATLLTSATEYDFFVKTTCGATMSVWAGPSPFITECGVASLPYTQDFESAVVPNLPICTQRENAGTGNNWVTVNNPGAGFTSKALSYGYSFSSPANAWFYTQALPLVAGTSYRISFKYGGSSTFGTEKLKVAYGTSASSASMTTVLLDFPSINQGSQQFAEHDFVPSVTGDYFFGFNAYSVANQYSLRLDDIRIRITPTCFEPTAVVVSNLNPTGATFSWTAPAMGTPANYTWKVVASGAAPTAVAVATGFVAHPIVTATTSALSPNTAYTIYIKTDCGAGDESEWTEARNFTTPCSFVNIPIVENFDGVTTPQIPSCWTKIASSSATLTTTTSTTPNTTPNHVYMYNGADAVNPLILVAPGIIENLNTTQVKFFAKAGAAGYQVILGTMSDPSNAATFTPLNTFNLTTTYTQYEFYLNNYVGTDKYVAFRHANLSTYQSIYLDDIQIIALPTCIKPLNLQATAITSTSASISWTSNSNSFSIEYKKTADADWTVVTDDASPYTLASLVPNTAYQVRMRTFCTPDYSEYSSTITFITNCSAVNIPITQNFDAVTVPALPDCWRKVIQTTSTGNITTITTTVPNSSPNHLLMTNANDIASNIIFVSPEIVENLNTTQVKFFAKSATAGFPIVLGTMTDPSNPATFTARQTFNLTTDYVQYEHLLNSYAGTDKYIAFKHGNGGTFRSIYVDDILIEALPACVKPTNLVASNITPSSAQVNWVNGGTETKWQVQLWRVNYDIDWTSVETTTNPYVFTDLVENQSYDVRIRAVCDEDLEVYSDWSNVLRVVIPCNLLDLPYTENFNIPDFPSCWTQTFGGALTSNRWEVSQTNIAGGTANEMKMSFQNNIGTSRLILPAFNTVGLSEIQLKFRTMFDDYGVGATLKIQTSSDRINWTDASYSYASGSGNIPSGTNVNVNLYDNLGATTYIAFVVEGNHFQIDYWYIDNVVVKAPSAEKEIVSVTVPNQVGVANINSTTGVATVNVLYGTDVTAVMPIIEVSQFATINPASGVVQDFSTNPVAYVVTAENNTTKPWTIEIVINPASTEAEIVSFEFAEQTEEAEIISDDGSGNGIVNIEVAFGTDRNGLIPTIGISQFATINPLSGVAQDFSTPFVYTVTAEDVLVSKTWTVNVTIRPPSQLAEIVSFTIPQQTKPAIINSLTGTVIVEVAGGTDFNGLIPTIAVSNGATINPASGVAQNFNTPVQYVVTAEDVTVSKTWTVIVQEAPFTLVEWTFPNNPDDAIADGGITANLSRTISTQGGTAALAFNLAGVQTNAVSATGWHNGENTKYWMVDFTTEGYKNISLTSALRSSNTGPKDFKIQYRIGTTGTWTDVPNSNLNVSTDFSTGTLDETILPAALNNAQQVFVRWIMTSNTNVNGGTVVAGGVNRIDNIIVRGNPVSNEAEILNFVPNVALAAPAVINSANATVTMTALYGEVVTNVTPAIQISNYASISPLSGVAQDFTTPVQYTVTAENGVAKVWTVTINVQPNPTYLLTLNAANGTTSGAGYYEEAENVTITATPNEGYEFVNWTDINGVVSTVNPYTFAMPNEALVYTANFAMVDYVVSVTNNPLAGGSVIGTGSFNFGDNVILTATPSTGYNFVNWTIGGVQVSTDLVYEFTMPSSNVDVVANYLIIDYTIELTSNPANGGTTTGAGTYNYGDPVTLEATPAIGYEFVNWTSAFGSTAVNPNSFTMPAENIVGVANFQMIDYTLTVNVNPALSGTVSGNSATHNYNESITLTATPEVGYEFLNWTINGVQVGSLLDYTFTMPASNYTINANFIAVGTPTYTLGLVTNPLNTGTLSGTGTYTAGTVVNVSAVNSAGYTFVNWTNGAIVESTNSAFAFTMPAENTTLSANMQAIDYSVAVAINPLLSGTVAGEATNYHVGDLVTLTATPAEGYEFVNWTDASGVLSDVNPYYLTMPAEDVNVTVNFQLVDYTVTASTNIAGAGTISGTGAFNFGQSVTLETTPNAGYAFVNWTVGGTEVSTSASYTFNMPSNNLDIVANYEAIDYDVTVAINPVATGSVTGHGTFNITDEVTLTATPIAGYEFVNWTNTSGEVSTANPYVFTMGAADVALTANFVAIDYTVSLIANPVAAGVLTGNNVYNVGNSVTVLATANAGYTFVSWTDGTGVVSTDASYSFTMPASNVALTANFSTNNYDVTVAVNPVSSGTVTGAGTYAFGANVNLVATPAVGYSFLNWTDVNGVVSTSSTYAFAMPAADVDLTANFVAIPQHDVTIAIAPVASGTATGAGTYYEGEEVTVTATAAAGYEFVNWTNAGGDVVSTSNPYTFTMGTADVALTANFVALDFTLTLQVNPINAGSVTGAGTHAFASVVAVNTTPASPNFVFVNWTKGADVVSTTAAFNYPMPAENVTLVANYQDVTAIADNNIEGVNVFPNPSTGIFNIVVGQEYSMQIVDVTGRLVVAKQIQSGLTALDMEQYKNGVYFIRLISESQIKTIRIVKQQ